MLVSARLGEAANVAGLRCRHDNRMLGDMSDRNLEARNLGASLGVGTMDAQRRC